MNRIDCRFALKCSMLWLGLIATACDSIQDPADTAFADQHFKTAVSLIELHKVRFGSYPENLGSIQFLGPWDRIALSAVEYKKLDPGYELDLKNNSLKIGYPADFWKGLGVVKTNVTGK